MDKTFYIITAIVFLVNFSLAFMPYFTRKTESFGVSIPEKVYNDSEFRSLRKQYATITVLINGLIIILFYSSISFVSETTLMTLFIVATILYLLSCFLVYLPFHYKMKRIKVREAWHEVHEQKVVVDTTFHREQTSVSYKWYIIPFFIVIVTVAYTFLVYDQIPDEVPIHTSFSGKVTYDEKSIGNLLILPFSQLFLLGTMLIVQYVINHSKQQISAENPERSKRQVVLFRRYWSLYLVISTYLITFMFSGLQLTFIYPDLLGYEDYVIWPVIAFLLIGAIVLSIRTGQGGSRMKMDSKREANVMDRDDDQYWKLGQFYVNKNDPSIFVEKRFGVGWTNNWAHPISWILLLSLIGLGLVIPLLFIYL